MSNFLINIFNTGVIVETRVYISAEDAISLWENYITALEAKCNAPYEIGVSSYSITPTDAGLPA
jgi:hypothetical protein